jgi:hypothetical protein
MASSSPSAWCSPGGLPGDLDGLGGAADGGQRLGPGDGGQHPQAGRGQVEVVQQRERRPGAPGQGQHLGLAGPELLARFLGTHPVPGLPADGHGRVRAQAAARQVAAPDRGDPHHVVVPLGPVGGRSEHDLGLVERPEVVERLAEDQAGGRRRPRCQRGPGQLGGMLEVVGVAGELRRPEQQVGIAPAGGLQPPRGDAGRVVAAAGAPGLDRLGLAQQDRPAPQGGEPGPQHLTVHGVGQPYRLPPTVGAHGDEALALQLLQHRETRARFQLAQAERLGQRELVEDAVGGGVEVGEPQLDQLPQPVGGGERPVEVPHPVPADQRTPGPGPEHQLAQRHHVAPAGVPQLGRGGGVERAFERHVEQGVHSQLVQVAQVDAHCPLVPPPADHGLGHRLARQHGGDTEQGPGGEQPVDQPERPVVDAVGVVEHQHGERRCGHGVARPETAQDVHGQQVDDRSEGDLAGRGVGRRPQGPAPGRGRQVGALSPRRVLPTPECP